MKKTFLSLAASLLALSAQAQSFYFTNCVAGNVTNTLAINTNDFPLLLTTLTVYTTNGQFLKFYDSRDNLGRYTNIAFNAGVTATGWQTNYYTNYWLGSSGGNIITNSVIASNIARVLFATNTSSAAGTYASNEMVRVLEVYAAPATPGLLQPTTISGKWNFTRGVTVGYSSNSQAILQLQYLK